PISLGEITAEEAQGRLELLADRDARHELQKYFYRNELKQQYAINVSGGTDKTGFYISGGYDDNISGLKPNGSDRKSINSTLVNRWLDNKLELSAGLSYTNARSKSSGHSYSPLVPYDKIADLDGKPLAVPSGSLRFQYADTAGNGQLLDWHYRPIDEIERHDAIGTTRSTRANFSIGYNPIPELQLNVMYQYLDQQVARSVDADPDSYAARDMVNRFTQIDKETGAIVYRVPPGGILDRSYQYSIGNYGRLQANYRDTFLKKLEINAIGGMELNDNSFGGNAF